MYILESAIVYHHQKCIKRNVKLRPFYQIPCNSKPISHINLVLVSSERAIMLYLVISALNSIGYNAG